MVFSLFAFHLSIWRLKKSKKRRHHNVFYSLNWHVNHEKWEKTFQFIFNLYLSSSFTSHPTWPIKIKYVLHRKGVSFLRKLHEADQQRFWKSLRQRLINVTTVTFPWCDKTNLLSKYIQHSPPSIDHYATRRIWWSHVTYSTPSR